MKRAFLLGVGLSALAVRPVGAVVTRDSVLAREARDLVALCSVADDDPMRHSALGCCHGCAVGAWQGRYSQ